MSAGKATPGPYDVDADGRLTIPRTDPSEPDCECYQVNLTPPWLDEPDEETHATLALIAAAPPLRDALAEAVRCLKWHVDNGRGVAMDGKAVTDGLAALAQAEGGAL